MSRRSAGLLLHRIEEGELQVLIVHPGGPFWARRDAGAWSLPKGEPEPGEDDLTAARREFEEETGWTAEGPFVDLGTVRQKSGKVVHGFAAAGDVDPDTLVSNEIDVEWPPRTGGRLTIPEVDRAGWFDIETARGKLNPAQTPFLDRLAAHLRGIGR